METPGAKKVGILPDPPTITPTQIVIFSPLTLDGDVGEYGQKREIPPVTEKEETSLQMGPQIRSRRKRREGRFGRMSSDQGPSRHHRDPTLCGDQGSSRGRLYTQVSRKEVIGGVGPISDSVGGGPPRSGDLPRVGGC